MSQIIIRESGMSFGPYLCSSVWEVEKSRVYKLIQDGVKIADFVFFQNDTRTIVSIVEAKSSAPRPSSKEDFVSYLEDVKDKIVNTLLMCISVRHQRFVSVPHDAPEILKSLNIGSAEFKLVLVINNFEKKWLPPLQDALKKALHQTIKTFALGATAVKVVNCDGAKRLGLLK